MVLDLLECDSSVVRKQGVGWSGLDCHVNWDVEDVLPAIHHGSLGQGGEEELESVWLEHE